MKKVYISTVERTPVVPINSGLEKYSEQTLLARTMEKVIKTSGIDSTKIDEIIMGNAKQTSTPSNCARHAQLIAKLPVEIPAFTVQIQSASSMQAVINGYISILSGNAETVLVGGTESMSQIPIEIQDARFKFDASTKIIFDTINHHVIGSQPIDMYGEIDKTTLSQNIQKEYNITESDIVEYKSSIQEKVSNINCKKLIPFEIRKKKEIISIDEDIYYSDVTTVAKPADGAASLIIASEESINKNNLPKLAQIKSYSIKSGSPKSSGMVNRLVIEDALQKADITVDNIDKVAIVEDNIPLVLAYRKIFIEMGMEDIDTKVNSKPSGFITGIPWGSAGAIALSNLLDDLENIDGKYGMVIVPAEGGQTMSLIVEK